MTKKKFNKRLTIASILILGSTVTVASMAVGVSDNALPFSFSSNPIFNVNTLNHFTSDPAIIQTTDSNGKNVLVMISSHDLEKNVDSTISVGSEWPMNGTYLYATSGLNIGDPAVTWYDHGPVVQESFMWSKQGANHMFAPDIQEFPADASHQQRQIWLYVPDIDNGPNGGTQRIGMAHANIANGLYDNVGSNGNASGTFTTETNYFQLLSGTGGNPLTVNTAHPGFSFDPGVFLDDAPGQNKAYMVYVDAPADTHHNLSMVAINADRMGGTYLGKIRLTAAWRSSSNNDVSTSVYMEGPDIFKLTTPGANARTYYYLVFAANVENTDQDNDTGYIGYAMCNQQEFAQSPATCWKFKGWIFGNQFTGRSNHPTLAQVHDSNPNLADHYYIFFHRVMPGFDQTTSSRSRQICAKEFEIKNNPGALDDGEIIGVTYPANSNNDVRTAYGTLDDSTRSIGKGFISFQDDDFASSADSKITLSSFRNVTSKTLSSSGFQLYYYVNVEPGRNLHADPVSNNNSTFRLSSEPIKHINLNTWAVVLDYIGGNIVSPATDLPGVNAQFSLHYDVPFLQPYGKSDDFSQPPGSYPAFTTRVGMFNFNQWMGGEIPDMYDSYTALRSIHKDNNGKFTYLTPSTANQNDGINSQYLRDGWDQQQWIVEPVTNFNGLNVAIPEQDKSRAVRIRNKWNNFYMTCNDVNQNVGPWPLYLSQQPPFFLILQQSLRWNWETQIWIKEDDANNGTTRYRSAWTKGSSTPLYLTLNNANSSGTQNVYAQPLNTGWDTQIWVSEVDSYSVVKTAHLDKNSQYTYLTAATTNESQGINNQYVQTGSDLQKWIFEPVTDFTNLSIASNDRPYAYRLRNKQTGYYATANTTRQTSSDGQPYYWLWDQTLNSAWTSQVWILDSVEVANSGTYQIRNGWKPPSSADLYLTLNPNTNNNGDKGKQDVYVRVGGYSAPGAPFTETQYWEIE